MGDIWNGTESGKYCSANVPLKEGIDAQNEYNKNNIYCLQYT